MTLLNGWPVRLAPAAAKILGRGDARGQVFSTFGPTVIVDWKPDELTRESIDERNLLCDGCGLPVRPFGDDAFCPGAHQGKTRLCSGAAGPGVSP